MKTKKQKPKDSNTSQSSIEKSKAPSQFIYERQRSSTSDVSHSVARDKRTKGSKTNIKKRLPIFTSICNSKKNIFKQQGLQAFGFKKR